MLDLQAILEIIPHRYPFLLIDRIEELEGDTRAVGIKNVSANEPYFAGHFPGEPVMPGVLIVEALAQTAAVLIGKSQGDSEAGRIPLFMGIDKARFRRRVVPGDQLRLEVEVVQRRRNICRVEGKATVDGEAAAEAMLLATWVEG